MITPRRRRIGVICFEWKFLRRNLLYQPRWLIVTVLAVGMLSVGSASASAAKPPTLEFRASLDKRSYASHEPVMISFMLKNTGKGPAWVNTRFYLSAQSAPEDDRDVYVILTAPSGKDIPCTFSYPTGLPKSDYFKSLEPGQEAASESPRDLHGFFGELKEPGTYTVRAVYHNVFGAELGLDTFKGTLKSPSVTFTITQ